MHLSALLRPPECSKEALQSRGGDPPRGCYCSGNTGGLCFHSVCDSQSVQPPGCFLPRSRIEGSGHGGIDYFKSQVGVQFSLTCSGSDAGEMTLFRPCPSY
ncbi:hypothetical protein Cadr_000012679 [Camelus dromedarius]|uniref:Uncharacterized protein n=1 Tax=Camelus dromedarius TaxID=9838 RepID=A0A5N4D9R8_CAMDR|nr:hypothetical protein Cadr_000012679 [Camelus dromedarius]